MDDMKKKTKLYLFLLVIVQPIIILLIIGISPNYEEHNKMGVIHVEQNQLKESGKFNLHGNWRYYKGKLLISDGMKGGIPDRYVSVPNYSLKGGNGKSTYQIMLTGLEKFRKYKVVMFDMYGEYKIYIDGKYLVYDSSLKYSGITFRSFVLKQESCIITIERKDLSSNKINLAPMLFSYVGFENYLNYQTIIYAFFTGILLCYICVFILESLIRKKGKRSTLIFIVLCSFYYILNGYSTLRYRFNIYPLGYVWMYNLVYNVLLILCFMAAFQFFRDVFENERITKITKRIIRILVLLMALIILIYVSGYVQVAGVVTSIVNPCIIVALFLIGIYAVVKECKDAKKCSFAMFIVFVGMLCETFRSYGFIRYEVVYVLPIALCTYLTLITAVIATNEKKEYITGMQYELLKAENEKQTILLMISQIKPHFIYNVLLAIKYLCRHDVEAAEKVIVSFSCYLRDNMDSISTVYPVSFNIEMGHVQNYLNLEVMRFQERIRVIWEIDEVDFTIPTLTLQPLVEVAIRNSVNKRKEGGTIRIISQKESDYYVVQIIDDGVGFEIVEHSEVDDYPQQYATIIGVQKRIQMIMDGDVSYRSTPGVGTEVTIRIPIENKM